MNMVIYLFYLLLEVVNSERILTTNRFNPIEVFNHLKRQKVWWLETGRAEPCPVWRLIWERRGEVGEVGVQAHVLVLQRDLEQREDDQDEDEVNLQIRISN